MKRREIKNVHEQAVLNNFKHYLLNLGKILEVLNNPEPPDAIVKIDGKINWIEITDAFLNKEMAESITSFLAEDKPHKAVPTKIRKVYCPDMQFNEILPETIQKKYIKNSIKKVRDEFGRGILLVGAHTPFSSARDICETERSSILNMIATEDDRFKEIYLYDGSGTNSQFFPIGL